MLQEEVRELKGRKADTAGLPAEPVQKLHGFLRGSVMIPDDVDLTAPCSKWSITTQTESP